MKKSLVALLFVLLVSCLTMAVSAESFEENENSVQENIISQTVYQSIIDKLNAEYGTDVHFATTEEIEKYSLSGRSAIEDTPEDFEARIREAIEVNKKANQEAIALAELMRNSSVVCARGNGVCISMGNSANAKYNTATEGATLKEYVRAGSVELYRYFDAKDVDGGMATLEAYVGLGGTGYWRFYEILYAEVLAVPELHGDILFLSSDYSYELYDSIRTCGVTYNGITLYADSYIVIDSNATRFASFWAGTGMS